jgi:TetR/AcrR family transcriptional regulator, repressor for neighboring sulfatase
VTVPSVKRPIDRRDGRPVGRDEVRAAVVEAAARRFAAEGPDASLRDIADDAGVNLGLIHRHVGNKDDLIRAVLASEIARGADTIGEAGDVASAMRRMLRASVSDGRYIRIVAWLLLRDPTTFRHQERFPGMQALRSLAGGDEATASAGPAERDAQLMAAVAAIFGWTVFGPHLRAAFGYADADPLEDRVAEAVVSIVTAG